MRFFISVPAPDDGTLTAKAEQVWNDFKQNVTHPLAARRPQFGETWLAAGGQAGVSVDYARGDRVHIILEAELLRKGADMETRLTLLHECIHTDFALGEHRQRWDRRQERCKTYYQELEEKESGASEPAEVLKHLRQRGNVAFTVIQLPDEIVAEQKLKRDYPELFEARARYYVEMQRRHEKEIATRQPDDPFWSFRVFHELLRTSFFIPLVQDMPELRAEMMRLAQNAEARLRDCATPDLVEFLLTLKPRLLAVSLEGPLTEAEAAYERLHDRIMSVDRSRPPEAQNLA